MVLPPLLNVGGTEENLAGRPEEGPPRDAFKGECWRWQFHLPAVQTNESEGMDCMEYNGPGEFIL